jgi:ketosteroid isomerase-like protein
MKLPYVFEERAPIFIELAWGISLSSASRLLVATILAGACAGNALANSSRASSTKGETAASEPTNDAIVALEKSAYEAWKSKNAAFWETFLSERFVGWGMSGKLDKVSATKEYAGADCDIRSYALSDVRVSPRGKQAALITYKATVDGTCGGQKIPANSWAAGVYLRDGSQWKATFHAQAAVVDPAAPPVKSDGSSGAQGDGNAKSIAQDARTGTLLATERAVWEAWKDHDAKRLSDLMADDISFINIFGIYLANKAEALKNWSGAGCDVTSVGVTDAAATMLSPTVGILTFKATADGSCFGQKVGPIWGSSIYVRHADAWKWTFGINVPARRPGSLNVEAA